MYGYSVAGTNERKTKIFMTCNSFNISARYEDYKNEFYERCTEEYTSEQIKFIEAMKFNKMIN